MGDQTYQKTRRKLSFVDPRSTHRPSFSQFASTNHLQLALDNLNQFIHESEQRILDEQQSIIDQENQIENLQNEITHLQTNIDALTNEIDRLTLNTFDMLARQSEGALIRHDHLLKESIEHINQMRRKRSDNFSFEQWKNDLTDQQEKLFLIRNQLDVDHSNVATNISLLKECQQQRNQFEQKKSHKQIELQTIQQLQGDYVQRQLRLQKLQTSFEQQVRVRNDIQQLEQYQQREMKPEADSTDDRLLESVNEIDEETIETSERYSRQQEHQYDYSFNKFDEYVEENQ